ncbi:glycosyltransferase involved in cell wall biosynthesis [Actimicrobium sp. GrIS 1.19]|uniref:glycosyltransferase n=1 Tax=Actimicrobium sp. GrIS 1.19 TaxID=3071708 RepID=UPI002E019DE6|nr:glycosyltransferase involved in cell wall biosynthesis [Actimicrobium sp. GrIS 1.19]
MKIAEDKRRLKTVKHLHMTKPHVSVLITTYNRIELLCKAVDSVLAQDYPATKFEVIIVDDGSTDNTRTVIEHKYGDRVRYLYKPNGKMISACTFGFAAAEGDIIAQLDSDDFWYPNKLSTCVPLFEQSDNVVAVFHDLDIHNDSDPSTIGHCWQSLDVRLTEQPCDGLASYLRGDPLPAWTSACLWRRAALTKILPFPDALQGFNDAYCARNIVFYGDVCATTKRLGGYLIHNNNDYGGGQTELSREKMKDMLLQNETMSNAFNHRCRAFGRKSSRRRKLIQKMAMTESHCKLNSLDGKWPAIKWLMKNRAVSKLKCNTQL